MEGFVRLRVRPWARRLVTRLLAILPALVVIALAGQEAQSQGESEAVYADDRLLQLLVFSQVVLSFQLPFAIVPLVWFTGDERRMGRHANPIWLKLLAWATAGIVVGLNAVLIVLSMNEWAGDVAKSGGNPWWIYGTVGPVALGLGGVPGLADALSALVRRAEAPAVAPTPALGPVRYGRIGVAVELERDRRRRPGAGGGAGPGPPRRVGRGSRRRGARCPALRGCRGRPGKPRRPAAAWPS